jgi:outer membrane protein assembly factor BamA
MVLLLLTVIMQACNLPKLARKSGPFLYENKVKAEGNRETRLISPNLSDYIKQKPNKRLFGVNRIGLRAYKLGNAAPNSRYGRFLQNKVGEAPVILDSALIESSIKGMRSYLKTQGFYYPEISYEVTGKIHKQKVTYLVKTNQHYSIRNLYLHIADKTLDSIARLNKDLSDLIIGSRITLDNLLKEKNRYTELYRNRGYFDFNKDFVSFDLDTNIGDYWVDVGINIPNPKDFQRYKIYQIRDITIRIEPNKIDSNKLGKDSISLGDFNYSPNTYLLNPSVFQSNLTIKKGDVFKSDNANSTFFKLNELRIFKAVNLNAIPIYSGTDSAKIDYQIRLQPSKKYDFIFEPQAITSDQSNLISNSTGRNYGIASQVTISNNNIFGRAEILQFTYRISVEAQRGDGIPKRPLFNSFESNLTGSLIFPKLIFLSRQDKRLSNTTNRSILSATTIWEKNIDWIRNVYGLSLTYQASKKKLSYYFVPAEISYIKTNFNSEELREQSKNDPYLQSVFSNNFVTSFKGGFIYNNQNEVRRKNYTFVKWDVLELAGTFIQLANLLLGIQPNDSGYRTFLGVQYFQYAKTYAEYRYNKYLDYNNRLASRLAIGLALPYGNSPSYVPFDKRFFTGGANSIRAFLPRSIGPGSYNAEGNLDRSGDVKLEANIEHRFNIYNNFLEGALFADGGNIWRIKEDGREGAVFNLNTFYKQLAIGGGFGLRLNLDFLIVRFDAAVPFVDPRRPEGNRVVFNEYSDIRVLFSKTILNFGVGYPF